MIVGLKGHKFYNAICLLYSAGLRASEVLTLKIKHIDSKRTFIKIVNGKGGKDRYTPLSERLLKELRHYYRTGQTWKKISSESYIASKKILPTV